MWVSLKLNVREICMLIKNLSVMKMPFLWAEEALFIGTHMQNYISKIHIELALEVYGKHILFAWNSVLLLISLKNDEFYCELNIFMESYRGQHYIVTERNAHHRHYTMVGCWPKDYRTSRCVCVWGEIVRKCRQQWIWPFKIKSQNMRWTVLRIEFVRNKFRRLGHLLWNRLRSDKLW